eukprot:GHRR01030263.1.p1 GENE.GHRR01030263.1~~GHRR01030263.1.p1  ORF type:complete len:166 (+),score=73.11 GHRR01030263.1:30-500(+)
MAELKLLKREYEQQQQQQQWRAASPAVPSELDKEQQQQGEESDDVICLDDSDSEPADEQQQQQYGVQQAASKARDNEYEGDELKTIEGAAESEASVAVDAAAAAIGALEIFWTGEQRRTTFAYVRDQEAHALNGWEWQGCCVGVVTAIGKVLVRVV